MDLVCPAVVDHHRRVGYIAMRLANQLGLSTRVTTDLALAVWFTMPERFSLGVRLDALAFDSSEYSHCETGYRLLRMFSPVLHGGTIRALPSRKMEQPHLFPKQYEMRSAAANLLFLADRIDVLMPRHDGACPNITYIRDQIRASQSNFNPFFVEAFFDLSTDASSENPSSLQKASIVPKPKPSWTIHSSALKMSSISRHFSHKSLIFVPALPPLIPVGVAETAKHAC